VAFVGVDTDQRKVAALRNGESYIEDVASSALENVSSKLHPTHRYDDLASCDTVVIAVREARNWSTTTSTGPNYRTSG
jgi:UDP-N-acetyl-D-mannosaminuronate dehydrogenase